MNLEEIYDADEYFDMNKLLQLRDKFSEHCIQDLLSKVIMKCKNLCKKYNIPECIRQANTSLLDLAKDPETTAEQFQEAANRLKVETGYDVWLRLGQVRGNEDMVKL